MTRGTTKGFIFQPTDDSAELVGGMSGRGRGRRGAEGASVTRGEPLLPSVQQPSPLFPAMEHKPLPLTCGEEAEYLLALKQELRGAMGARPGFIQPHAGHRSHADVERYSDKYHNSSEQTDALTNWITDWKRFPKEIQLCVRRSLKTGVSGAAQRSKRGRADEQKASVKEKQVLLKLEVSQPQIRQHQVHFTAVNTPHSAFNTRCHPQCCPPLSSPPSTRFARYLRLRCRHVAAVRHFSFNHLPHVVVTETLANEEQRGSEEEKEDNHEVDEEYEEELEEDTDYIMSYFDNGEDFGTESDDDMDEAVY
ncbi:DNA-directed RNA polymerase III subunit RPC7-like isoform X2 [Syngnathus typhle]|uniref:DNA-directed RNA polymerase III subunit RPC7-like isoform X2 n=1 Tax=Syngnathus typhle TaxID=161592 RepID=UPI002A6B17AE|nr:DNA-directed RNA polymerase III subunit RPC7-like isoform X2 [Syngnathus typhle]